MVYSSVHVELSMLGIQEQLCELWLQPTMHIEKKRKKHYYNKLLRSINCYLVHRNGRGRGTVHVALWPVCWNLEKYYVFKPWSRVIKKVMIMVNCFGSLAITATFGLASHPGRGDARLQIASKPKLCTLLLYSTGKELTSATIMEIPNRCNSDHYMSIIS